MSDSIKAYKARRWYPIVTQARLHQLLSYSPETGDFIWLEGRCLGSIAGASRKDGYQVIRIDNRLYLAHRLAWLYVYGVWPANMLDHVNRTASDNRILNLRECTNQENCQNVKAHKDGAGVLGVSFEKRRGRWQAGIGNNCKRIFLGYFSTKEDAHKAYLNAKHEIHTFGSLVNG